ncbi:YfgM family protein [Marinimicrobium alkaliphilum]|uniref:YfgM family protein n=1 Tax=Marinimicrobium alkaliphilum TaxID=2202654 RepID=UPI000DB9386F|nr:tetratricopeptide repeat protein [Marinimicrobium alkaliphilum]
MSDTLTEEEQLEAIKRWWKENGKFLVLAVVFGVGGWFTWGAWQDQREAKAEAASARFEQLLNVMDAADERGMTEERQAAAAELVEQIKADNSRSLYAQNAAMLMARIAVQNGELERAQRELEWVLDNNRDEAVEQLARVRLARVLYAQEEHDAALALIEREHTSQFAAKYAELKGDILLAQGDAEAARAAYQSALDALTPDQQQRSMLLQMKLDDVQAASGAGAHTPVTAGEETV